MKNEDTNTDVSRNFNILFPVNKDLEDALVEEYERKHKQRMKVSYLQMTQKVCGKVLNACPTVDLLDLNDEVFILLSVSEWIPYKKCFCLKMILSAQIAVRVTNRS